jgi:hypothetical protein
MNDTSTIIVYRQHSSARPVKTERGLIWCDKNIVSTIDRIYPAQSDNMKAQRILKGFTDFFGEFRYPVEFNLLDTHRFSHAYEDYNYYKHTTRSLKPLTSPAFSVTGISVGEKAHCIKCGLLVLGSESLYCSDCSSDKVVCEDCGAVINSDDAIYINGSYYCDDCVFYCDECNDYHSNDEYNEAYVSGWGRGMRTTYVCDSCLTNYFVCCDGCGDYFHNDLITVVEEEHNKVEEGCFCGNCYYALADIEED